VGGGGGGAGESIRAPTLTPLTNEEHPDIFGGCRQKWFFGRLQLLFDK
jgi:hypothetical protein